MSRERPILMHGRSVQGIRAGRKTQTRRIINPQPVGKEPQPTPLGWTWWHVEGQYPDDKNCWEDRCPPYLPGDVLYVREAWAAHFMYNDVPPREIPADGKSCLWYRSDYRGPSATNNCVESQRGRWRPGIHMPKAFARLHLPVVSVWPQRIHDITMEDCLAEGVQGVRCHHTGPSEGMPGYCGDCLNSGWQEPPQVSFMGLWDDTNGPGAWARNDWVWVITFELRESNGTD